MMFFVVLLLVASAAFAQESRQDVSVSGQVFGGPQVYGNAVTQNSTFSGGFLLSYRYMLTPRSALEVNYGWGHNAQKFSTSSLGAPPPGGSGPVYIHTRQQEMTAAYVYTRNYRNFNPFAEIGIGALVFTPMRDNGTQLLDTKQNTNVGGLAGIGLAYEISPSFDVRVEYRGFLAKAPNFNYQPFRTNRYEWFSMPAIGIAYHF